MGWLITTGHYGEKAFTCRNLPLFMGFPGEKKNRFTLWNITHSFAEKWVAIQTVRPCVAS